MLRGLQDSGGGFQNGLEAVIRKAMKHGLKDARIEIRNDKDLQELGIEGEVEKALEGVFESLKELKGLRGSLG